MNGIPRGHCLLPDITAICHRAMGDGSEPTWGTAPLLIDSVMRPNFRSSTRRSRQDDAAAHRSRRMGKHRAVTGEHRSAGLLRMEVQGDGRPAAMAIRRTNNGFKGIYDLQPPAP